MCDKAICKSEIAVWTQPSSVETGKRRTDGGSTLKVLYAGKTQTFVIRLLGVRSLWPLAKDPPVLHRQSSRASPTPSETWKI